MTGQKLGKWGENLAVNALIRHYELNGLNRARQGDFSLKINGRVVRFEVKTATRNYQNKWLYCLRRDGKGKKHKTNVEHSDYVIFIQVLNCGLPAFYVVPTAELETLCPNQKILGLCNAFNNKLNAYRTGCIYAGVNRYERAS